MCLDGFSFSHSLNLPSKELYLRQYYYSTLYIIAAAVVVVGIVGCTYEVETELGSYSTAIHSSNDRRLFATDRIWWLGR